MHVFTFRHWTQRRVHGPVHVSHVRDKMSKTFWSTHKRESMCPLIRCVALHAAAASPTSPWQPGGRCRTLSLLTGSGSAANKPVVEKCSYGVKASPMPCHYPAPSRLEGDHHFHITNRRLLFRRQFPQVEN